MFEMAQRKCDYTFPLYVTTKCIVKSENKSAFLFQSAVADACQSAAFALSNLAQGGESICR